LRFSDTFSLPFDASHVIPDDERCGRPHGHGYTVTVTITAERLDKNGGVPHSAGFERALRALVAEMDHRDLDVMFPGIRSTPLGLAMMVLERLSLGFPRIDEVTVCESQNRCSRVQRPPTP
jgi:6-pyruvoyl-tetrahydropterin synthase